LFEYLVLDWEIGWASSYIWWRRF